MNSITLALGLSLVACGGAPFTIADELGLSDAGAEETSKIDAPANQDAAPEATPPERDALAPDASPAPDARPDAPPDAGALDARRDGAVMGGVCKVHADCAGACAATDLKPVCDDPGGLGTGTCWCAGCTPGAAESQCVAQCAASGKTADAGARPYCEGPAGHQLPDRTPYTATVCYCGT